MSTDTQSFNLDVDSDGIKVENKKVICEDSFVALDKLPENHFHAIVTDPPYNFDGGFMGQEWDNIGSPTEYQQWCQEWSEKALKCLKPGGHLIAFSGDTTHHRLFSGVEDAGYEIRHGLYWHYGEGFPKGSRLKTYLDDEDEIAQWGNWRGKLKPACEPAVLARAPFSGSAVGNQVEHGTGNLNVEECRIDTEDDTSRKNSGKIGNDEVYSSAGGSEPDVVYGGSEDGRYPANVVFDESVTDVLDEQSGFSESEEAKRGDGIGDGYHGSDASHDTVRGFDDEGGASRFFYTSKANKSERTHDGQIENNHKTVKPIDLMEWLVKLVTAEDQWVLDPFCGSGTTMLASQNVGRNVMGIDASEKWCDLTEQRLALNGSDDSNSNETKQTELQ